MVAPLLIVTSDGVSLPSPFPFNVDGVACELMKNVNYHQADG